MIRTIFLALIFISVCFCQGVPVKTFYTNGNVKSEITYVDSMRNGDAKFYFDDGNLKEKLSYDNGKANGLVEIYNKNGKLKETFNVDDGVRQGPTSLYDSNGVYLSDVQFTNGRRVNKNEKVDWDEVLVKSEKEQNAKLWRQYFTKRYDLGAPKAIVENFYEDDPAYFLTAEKMPEPVGGIDAIESKIKYPEQAIKTKTEGTVKVLAYVNRRGNVIDAEVIQGIGNGCDKEAKNIVLNSKFIPGLIHNDPVNVQVVIPVTFSLTTSINKPPKVD